MIVYFSQTGNTDGLANLIHEISGFDIFRLERATPYASSSNGPVLYGEALNELRAEAVPELKEYPDIGQYDTILLGYCNWWSSIPACVRTFLTRNDLSGKIIVPFCSMGGGRFGQTISAIAKLAPNSVIKEGLEVTYSSYDRAEIRAWLDALGYPNWWASIPMPVASFLEEYDFTGKTIVPFCSHGGGRFGQSLTAITKLVPDAVLGEGLAVNYSGGTGMPDDVAAWLEGNSIHASNTN